MNVFVIRHADRDQDGNTLNKKGLERSRWLAHEIPRLIGQWSGIIHRIYYFANDDYGVRCNQTIAPLCFYQAIPIEKVASMEDLQKVFPPGAEPIGSHADGLEPFVVVVLPHELILPFVISTFALEDPEMRHLFWDSDNFCTGLVIRRGAWVETMPLCLYPEDGPIYQKFISRVVEGLNALPYHPTPVKTHLPPIVQLFLENLLFERPDWAGKVLIFGGWITYLILGDLSPTSDIDIYVPYDTLDEMLHVLQVLKQKYPRFVQWETRINYDSRHSSIQIDLSGAPSIDIGNIRHQTDFVCNTGFFRFPFLEKIEFEHPRGRWETQSRILSLNMPLDKLLLRRFYKMMEKGFRITDPKLFRAVQEAFLERRSKKTERLDPEETRLLAQWLGLDSDFSYEPDHLFQSIAILGGTPRFSEEWVNQVDQMISRHATIYIGITFGGVYDLAFQLFRKQTSRKIVLVQWDHPNSTDKTKDHSSRAQTLIQLGFQVKSFSNLLSRTDYLLCPNGKQHDYYFVVDGQKGTEMEVLVLEILDLPFSRLP